MDNSAAERALRTVVLGRKNYLFDGSDSGGERAAAIYTLLGTAKLNGLDPELYLRHILERIAPAARCNVRASTKIRMVATRNLRSCPWIKLPRATISSSW